MKSKILVIDLGGTNLRVGIGDPSNLSVSEVSKTQINSSEDFYHTLKHHVDLHHAREVVLSAAGPKIDGCINMTNRDLKISPEEIKQNLGLEKFLLLNDWESIGYSVPLLKNDDFKILKNGKNKEDSTCLALGPGTGLGFAVIRKVRDDINVYPTELGNTQSFNHFLMDLFEITEKKNFNVLEDFISGTGIRKIYTEKTGKNYENKQILDLYHKDEIVTELIDNFVLGLSKILSDLALIFNPEGGVFLAGGLLRKLDSIGCLNNVSKTFADHLSKSHNTLLENTTINLIEKEHTPLYGNLNYSVIRRKHE